MEEEKSISIEKVSWNSVLMTPYTLINRIVCIDF